MDSASLAVKLASLTDEQRAEFFDNLSEDDALALEYDWRFWARPNQLPPEGDWSTWLLMAGRGYGKSRSGAEWIRAKKETAKRIALVGATAADVRDVMVEGQSGLLSISPPWDRPLYEPSKRRLSWANGAVATLFSADEPERLRGPEHEAAWCDEIGAWRYPEAWDMLMFGLRLGNAPQVVVTTTPKPGRLVREILASPDTVVTRGTTYENAANLAKTFLRKIVKKYEGTRLGRQELMAELLEDIPGALFSRRLIDAARIVRLPEGLPPSEEIGHCQALSEALGLYSIVIGVDPSGAGKDDDDEEGHDEIGIVATGVDHGGHAYVLEDASGTYSPEGWGAKVVQLYQRWNADRIVAEINFGGAMVVSTIRAAEGGRNANVKVVTASRGKVQRAEPVAALYERGMIHHIGGFATLEDQLCSFTRQGYKGPGSPDRADAMVWTVHDLLLDESGGYDLLGAVGMR